MLKAIYYSFLIMLIVGLHQAVSAQTFDYSRENYLLLADLSNDKPDSTLILINKQLPYLHPDSLSVKANYFRLLGLVNLYKVDYTKALDFFISSHEIFDSIGDKAGLAKSLSNIAVVYSIQGLAQKSIALDKQVLEMYIEMGDTANMAGSYNNMAVGYTDLKLYNKALCNYFKAIELATKAGMFEDLSMYFYNVGGIHLDNGSLDSAYFYFNKSLQNSIDYPDRQSQANALCNLGQYYINVKKYSKAIDVLSQSLEIAKEIQIVYEIESATQYLHEAYAAIGNYEKAYQMMKWYKQLVDSANNREVIRKIVQIEESVKYKKELELQQLQQDKERLEVEVKLQQRKSQRNIAYFAVALFVIGLVRLYRSYKRREKENQRLFANNEEIKLQKEEIEAQRDQIQDLNTNKDKFFGIIAHDLKNPLSGIARLSELLYSERNELPEDKKDLYIRQIADSSNKAYNLLENLLQWAMVQLGRAPVELENTDLNDLIQDSIDLFKSNTQEKNVSVAFKKLKEAQVLADEQMTRTIIRNLLGNAVKFTPEHGTIYIELLVIDGFIQVCIKDSGIGIEEKDMAGLFDAGTSSKGVGNSKEKGNGLGLILCMEFVHQCGGKIWAESEFGQGSIFCFTLPIHI